MRTLLRLSLCAVLVSACGGGGGNNNNPGGGGGSGFSARIDGQSWQAEPIGVTAAAVSSVPGALVVVGSQTSGGVTRSLTLSLYNISGPGTYPLGVSSDVFGGIGQVGEGTGGGNSQAWITDNTGAAGTITLTSLSGGRIVGTFAFVAAPGHTNTVGGTRTVTDGAVDLPLSGTLAPVPANVGSTVTAQLGGQSYTASAVNAVATSPLGGPGLQLSSSNKDHGLSITLGEVSAPGTYALDNMGGAARLMNAGRNGGDANHCCWGGGHTGADVGSVTITSLTADRVKGTFTATLQPVPGKPASTVLSVTSGSFDVGLMH
ncbi:MAG TPA: hypothetical protein VFN45_16065 [Myxococcaceae bacterium]|nr:hypothetical protein [Myxococcaceae bacterium]